MPLHEREQGRQLRRMRLIATGLLALMAVVFVAARLLEPRYAFLAFVGAFAEAAMVGALADWFAVTALFRRPMGLPIPHTAIIPRNKDRIGTSIAGFLEHNFMAREVLEKELQQMDFAGAAVNWLQKPENSHALSLQLVAGIPALARMVEDREVSAFLQRTVQGTLGSMHLGPIVAEVLSVLIADRRHQALFDHLIGLAAQALEQNQPLIRQKIHENSPRWVPRMFDEKLFVRLLDGTQKVLDEMQEEGSEWREQFQQAADNLIEQLRHSPEYEDKIKHVVSSTLEHPLFLGYVQQIWQDARTRIVADAQAPDSVAVAQLDRALQALVLSLAQDLPVRGKLNQWLRTFAVDAIHHRRQMIAALVERVIQSWDAETVSRKFELYVGKDLQYIRINGTIVGGLVGLLLHVIKLGL